MRISPDKTIFTPDDIVYDNEGKYVVLNYHMPQIERDGQIFIENDGMLDCMSLTTGDIIEKSEIYLTAQGEYDVYQEGNLVSVFKPDTIPFGETGTIIYKGKNDYMIKVTSTGEKINLRLYDEPHDAPSASFFIPRWIDQRTLESLGFKSDTSGKVWSDGITELISAKPVVVSDDPQVNYREAILNYGYTVRIVKEDMLLIIVPEQAENVIRAVHELQNIYESQNVRKELDISGLL